MVQVIRKRGVENREPIHQKCRLDADHANGNRSGNCRETLGKSGLALSLMISLTWWRSTVLTFPCIGTLAFLQYTRSGEEFVARQGVCSFANARKVRLLVVSISITIHLFDNTGVCFLLALIGYLDSSVVMHMLDLSTDLHDRSASPVSLPAFLLAFLLASLPWVEMGPFEPIQR
jgi:hypothetical protein